MTDRSLIMKRQVLEACIKTRDMLTPETNWTQKVFARNNLGFPVQIISSAATCYCWAGCLSKICDDPTGMRTELYKLAHAEFMTEVKQEMKHANYIVDFNDRHT